VFSIKLLAGKTPRTANAEILIDKYSEKVEVPLQYWKRERYREQWRGAIARIASGHTTACLITAMYDPRAANFIMWWPMWRQGERVFIQNQILFMDKIRTAFNEMEPHRSIPARAVVDEDGAKVSEWSVDIKDILDCASRMARE